MANPVATFKTSVGQFTAEIYLDRVPITASNFIDLCNSGLNPHRFPHQKTLISLLLAQASTMVSTSTELFPTS